MKKEKTKSPSKAPQREEDRWVNVHSDSELLKYGVYRASAAVPRDKSVWSRTPHERRILASLGKIRKIYPFNTKPMKLIPVRGTLVIYLRKNKKYPKTTYSTECWQHEIPEILMNYRHNNKKSGRSESLVTKYSFLGRTYSNEELPFWN